VDGVNLTRRDSSTGHGTGMDGRRAGPFRPAVTRRAPSTRRVCRLRDTAAHPPACPSQRAVLEADRSGPRRWGHACAVTDKRIPEDLLGYPAECDAMLDYLGALMTGADDDERFAIERAQGGVRTSRDKKIKLVMRESREQRPDVAGVEPYVSLPSKLKQLFDYRDKIAHSAPDHGDRYRRFRRVGGVNEVVIVTQEEVDREWQRGIECQSALRFITVYLSGLDQQAGEST
jgi:hypothetical protein